MSLGDDDCKLSTPMSVERREWGIGSKASRVKILPTSSLTRQVQVPVASGLLALVNPNL